MIMATKQLSNASLQRALAKEAWKELFSYFEWTESMLEKYQDKVDWDKISENENVRWTIPMIQKFQNKINWDIFSESINPELLNEKLIGEFQDKWNWQKLSDCNFNYIKNADKVLKKFAHKWDWRVIIKNNWYEPLFENKGIEFYEKYKDYIPEYEINDTYLWNEMVSQIKAQLIKEITTEDND